MRNNGAGVGRNLHRAIHYFMRQRFLPPLGIILVSLCFARALVFGQDDVQLITRTTQWRYNRSGTDLGVAWIAPSYDDTLAGWEGPAQPLFGFETDEGQYNALGVPFLTRFADPLGVDTNGISNFRTNFYFRTHFNLPSYPDEILTNILLRTTNWFDDGVAYYLNGVELLRANMPAGTILANTFASGTLTEPIQLVLTNLATNLVVGDMCSQLNCTRPLRASQTTSLE
jgi:hypothetical protein